MSRGANPARQRDARSPRSSWRRPRCRARAAGARWRASSSPSARSAGGAGTRRTPRRSRGSARATRGAVDVERRALAAAIAASGTPSQTSSLERTREKPITRHRQRYTYTYTDAAVLHDCPTHPLRPDADRSAHPAVPARRPGGVGRDRPAALAEGLQRRLQVRRPARRSRGSDAGHLPEDLQVARHVRSARELPDVADQRQPQPLHRSLPQRPQGARDDRPPTSTRTS